MARLLKRPRRGSNPRSVTVYRLSTNQFEGTFEPNDKRILVRLSGQVKQVMGNFARVETNVLVCPQFAHDLSATILKRIYQ